MRLAALATLSCHGILLVANCAAGADDAELGLRLPPGFEVTEFADEKLANDIYTIAFDAMGRLTVAGRGYIRILLDDDGDGRADHAHPFADGPKDGAMGMLWEGSSLFFTGEGGLRRFRDDDHDLRADGPSELILPLKTGGEHHAHAIRRGPDGWLYVICGNQTGIDASYAQLPTSPIHQPVGGCVLRLSPDLQSCEIVADGYRNAYDMDFNLDGELFTFDSDNERCVSLPWYEYTRFYHVMPGGHHGWQSPQRAETWRFPPHFEDVVAPVASIARGSPTGVACYRHIQFPDHFRGGMFILDWTFGLVYFMPLAPSGSTYTSRAEVFLQPVGDNGFAPTDVAVHPQTGDLFISIGGRGTRGGVYRVRYSRGRTQFNAAELAHLASPARSLFWRPGMATEVPEAARSPDALYRRRALDAALRHRGRFLDAAVVGMIRANWGDSDRYVRQAAARLMRTLEGEQIETLSRAAKKPRQHVTYCLALADTKPREVRRRVARLFEEDHDPGVRIVCVRLWQLAAGGLMDHDHLGTVWEGYSRGRKGVLPQLPRVMRDAFPSSDAVLDRELARTFAMLRVENADLLRRVTGKITPESDPLDDLHYLIVLSRLPGERTTAMTQAVAASLLRLDQKIASRRMNIDRHWPSRVGEMYRELRRLDPGLDEAVLSDPAFGRPAHGLFARTPSFDRRRAAEIFAARAAADAEFLWTPQLIALLAELPEEQSFPIARSEWPNVGLRESIVDLLGRRPQQQDRGRFLEALASPQFRTVTASIQALEQLAPPGGGESVLALLRAVRQVPNRKETAPLRRRLVRYLERMTGQREPGENVDAWQRWFAEAYPALALQLTDGESVNIDAWKMRMANIRWASGETQAGHAVYTKAACITCHTGSRALGPDLHGITRRFSRDDLFTAILSPSRNVPERYRTTLLVTTAGQLHQGTVIYEAVDGLILQTGPDETLRFSQEEVVQRQLSAKSAMPGGLLDKLTDDEIAHLYAYLKSLDD